MKAFSTILFAIGLVLVCAGMICMKSFHYLIPTCIGVVGIMLMWIGIEAGEAHEGL